MSHAVVGRWGKSLAVRLPSEVADAAGIVEGDRVEIETHEAEVIIRRISARFTLEELFSGKTPAEWRALYADAYDWGPDVGREVVEE
jgi:antitoxin MazE